MIVIDRREGKGESDKLVDELTKLGVEAVVGELEYGDAAFSGSGEFGDAMIGVERKKLSDLINSMQKHRLSGHQLRGLWEHYDYVWLVTEGLWRPGPAGEIEEYMGNGWRAFYSRSDRHAVAYRQLDSYLNSLSLRSRSKSGEPVHVKRSSTMKETAAIYASLWHGYQKPWEDHHAHDQVYAKDILTGRANGRVGLVQAKPTSAWMMAAQIPGVDRKAEMVAKHFGSVREMTLAGLDPKLKKMVVDWFQANPQAAPKAWMQISSGELTKAGKKKPGFGPETAAAAVRAIAEIGG